MRTSQRGTPQDVRTSLSQLLFGSTLTPHTVVALDDVEVVVSGVCDHLPRGVRKWHRVLLEFRPEVRNLEDTKVGVSRGSRNARRRV
jgi:hypothetical protein